MLIVQPEKSVPFLLRARPGYTSKGYTSPSPPNAHRATHPGSGTCFSDSGGVKNRFVIQCLGLTYIVRNDSQPQRSIFAIVADFPPLALVASQPQSTIFGKCG